MKSSELLKLLEKDGWFAGSQKGSHLKMKHTTMGGLIIFPNYGSG